MLWVSIIYQKLCLGGYKNGICALVADHTNVILMLTLYRSNLE